MQPEPDLGTTMRCPDCNEYLLYSMDSAERVAVAECCGQTHIYSQPAEAPRDRFSLPPGSVE
jgi:hypothetical protein